ncbi:MAG: DoxX family protein [Amphritea sp.]
MMSVSTTQISRTYQGLSNQIDCLQPLALLFARLYVSWVFFTAGLTKLRDWDSTLFLFEEEYQVPIIPYELAAYLGTAGEIILPVLLALGLGSRFAALGLSCVNIVAVLSLEEIAPAGLKDHILWGTLLAQVVIFSGGSFSLDKLIKNRQNN